MQQLPLNIRLRDDATFKNFYAEGNSQVLFAIKQVLDGIEQYAYLYGEHGVGKTHLLQAACFYADEQQQTSFYLPLAEKAVLDIALLEGMDNMDLVCIDDVHHIAGDYAWEEALMAFYNNLKASGKRLIITGSNRPNDISFILPDLSSRLNWGMAYRINSLSDTEKLNVLQARAKNRGLALSVDVGHYLLSRSPRNMAELLDSFDKLDRASLSAKRKLTIPFVKEVLDL